MKGKGKEQHNESVRRPLRQNRHAHRGDLFIWDLVRQAPTPAAGSRLRLAQIERMLSTHRITRFTAEEVRNVLRTQPLTLAEGAAQAASEHVVLLLPQVALLDQQLREVRRRIKQLLKTLEQVDNPDVAILLSIPGVGPGISATLLSEASRPIRERDYHSLRCLAGVAPVTKQSAKRRAVSMRQACSPKLGQALHHWSTRSIVCDERNRRHYDRLRAAGHQHARALRGVSDRLLAMLISMLKQQTSFDPSRRQSSCVPYVSGNGVYGSGQPLTLV